MNFRFMQLTRLARRPLLVLFLAFGLAGCGRSGPRTFPVSGAVTYDGNPIAEGDILFLPADETLAPEGGKIKNGKYQMVSKAGICRVKVSALDIGPDTERMMGSPIAANYIPRRFNEETILTAEVVPGGENVFNFDLTSKSTP